MDRRMVLGGLGVARLAIGAALLVAPERCARVWMGSGGGRGARVFARVVGARDLALGGLALASLRSTDRTLAPRMAGVGAAMDAADALASLVAARDIDGARRWAMPAFAAAAAAAGAVASSGDTVTVQIPASSAGSAPGGSGRDATSGNAAERAGVVDQQDAVLEMMEDAGATP